MKRADFIQHLRRSGCRVVREGAKHSVFLHHQVGRILSSQQASGRERALLLSYRYSLSGADVVQ